MFDFCCKHCGFYFFIEEGYDAESDTIICPRCKRKHIEEE